jgi:hypothetical protein
MSMRRILLLCAFASLAPSAVAIGQEGHLEPGQAIRVTAHTFGLKRTPVTLDALGPDTLHVQYTRKRLDHGTVVTDSVRQPLPLDAVSKIEIPAGRRSNWDRGARTGAIVGGAVGLLLGAALLACGGDDYLCPDEPAQAVGGMVAATATVGLAGGLVGALIGAMSTRERWWQVPTRRVPFAITRRSGGLALVASISF